MSRRGSEGPEGPRGHGGKGTEVQNSGGCVARGAGEYGRGMFVYGSYLESVNRSAGRVIIRDAVALLCVSRRGVTPMLADSHEN